MKILQFRSLISFRVFLVCLPCFVFIFSGIAQPLADSSAVKTESLRLGINTFSTGNVADYRSNFSKNQNIQTQIGQYGIYNKALPSKRFIVSNVWTSIFHNWRISKHWALENEAWQYSFLANQTRLAQFSSRVNFIGWEKKESGLLLSAGAGLVNDKRLNNNNSGQKLYTKAEYFTQIIDSSFQLRIAGEGSNTQIKPRSNSRISGIGTLSKEFESNGFLSTEIGFLKSRIEDYLGKDIQSIISDTLYAKAKLRFELYKNLVFDSENQYVKPNRSFFYRNAESGLETRNVLYFQDEFQSQNSLKYNSKKTRVSFQFETRQRNRTYDVLDRSKRGDPNFLFEQVAYKQRLADEKIKDIQEQFITYTTDARFKVSDKHLIRVNYVAQLLRVDTKSELNNQDRDEILYATEGVHEWSVFNNFRLINKFSASLRHLIYIEASQSSENFKDRIIRWEPGFRWSKGRLNWSGQLGIWATYQVRDFERQQEKNRSNRVLIFAHQADYKLNHKFKVLADFLRRENRLSQLNWDGFTESPIDTVTIYDISLKGQYAQIQSPEKEFALQIGYRTYWQIRKSKASLSDPAIGARLIYLKTFIVQQGPQLRLLWTKSNRFRLMTEFWFQLSSQYFKYKKSEELFIGNSFTLDQLNLKDERFQPYFTIQGIWFIKKR